MKKKIDSYRAFAWQRITAPVRLLNRGYWRCVKRVWKLQRIRILMKLVNLPPDSQVPLSQDETALLSAFARFILPSPLVTRKGKIIKAAPELEDVTLWAMIEARRAETALERVKAWCGFSPETIADLMKLSKFVEEEINRADRFEEAVLPAKGGKGGSDNPITEAKNILGFVQISAELFHCSFEEAKECNYSDVILAIAKRHDEVEMQKQRTK